MEKTLLFIYNPKSGTGKIKTALSDVVDVFNRHGYEVLIHATQRRLDAAEIAQKYAGKVEMIVCSGGDGTLDEVVTGVMRSGNPSPIGYIPAGSTNDFAASLFMPKGMVECAENIMSGEHYFCDLGKFNNRTFTYVAAFGLFSDVSYDTPQDMKNVFGHMAYILKGAQQLLDIKSYHFRVECEEIVAEDDFIYGMVTNSRSVGGFKNLTGKNVDMDDGLFEVTLIKMPKNLLELNEILTALTLQEDNTDMIYSFKTRKILFHSEEEISWALDGEDGGAWTEVEIENQKQALDLCMGSSKKHG
ncbi:MAG: diacylglycerol kinase family lipid kinase [Blautia sp.]|nr:diacylglycerol kinase family lipid kinase [Blautia sp.]